MTTDLAKLVDLTYAVQEDETIIAEHHGAKCPHIITTGDSHYCDMLADGANLCVEEHSKNWWKFVHCMYGYVSPTNEHQDKGNPLANETTFDVSVTTCHAKARVFEDYDIVKFGVCLHGPEAVNLRKKSAAKTAADMQAGKPPTVWMEVDGNFVQAPLDRNDDRTEWKKDLRSAICDAASAHTSDPEVKLTWDKECASMVVV